MKARLLFIVLWFIVSASAAFAQTSSFTYQGRLTDGGTAANGNYDLQFALFDSLSGGAQVGSTQALNAVAVSNGVFTVTLDFGANAFPGASRFLDISARPAGSGSFTLLSPRQPITSTPYAVRSLNATSADSVPASGVPAGSGNYIQNTGSPQVSSNFNITGNGTAGGTLSGNTVNATTQYNINGSRILSGPGADNLFAGVGAGAANTTGVRNTFIGSNAGSMTVGQSDDNTFIGSRAGRSNTDGAQNTFVGASAGFANIGAGSNAFFGFAAGSSNTVGTNNVFVGSRAGFSNNTGSANSFFGDQVALNNSSGGNNAFFGFGAASVNGTGSRNAFFGASAGFSNTTGNENSLLGFQANVGSSSLTNATAVGAKARVDASNALVLGSINGINGATADTSVGIGTTAPFAKLSVIATGDGARVLHLGTERGWVFKQLGTGASTALELAGADPNNNNKNFVINTDGNVGIGTTSPDAKLEVNGHAHFQTVQVSNINGAGTDQVCRGGDTRLHFCSSSLRYKQDVSRFDRGLAIIRNLRPIAFAWKEKGNRDIGLAAEEVEKVEPLLTFRNDKGEIEGVRYNQLSAVFINAFKEQQAEIATLQQLNSALNARLHRVERMLRKRSSAARRR